jgi:hypothetical protein
MKTYARMAAYLQAFLTWALGKEDRHVLVTIILFAEKKPYPVAVTGFFLGHNLSSRTMALGSTQPVTDLSKR